MNSRSAKVPIQGNSLSTSKKKETPAETPKTSGLLKTGAKPIGSSAKLDSKSRSVSTRDQPTEGVQTEGAIDVEEKDDKAPGLTNAAASVNKTPVTKPKFEYGAKFESKPAVAVKNKTTKSPTKTVAGGHLSSVKKEASVGVKRHPKFGKTTKAKERLTSEAVGPASIQSERMAQIRRTNLDTLKKILDKSLSAQNKPVKPEEANSAKVN